MVNLSLASSFVMTYSKKLGSFRWKAKIVRFATNAPGTREKWYYTNYYLTNKTQISKKLLEVNTFILRTLRHRFESDKHNCPKWRHKLQSSPPIFSLTEKAKLSLRELSSTLSSSTTTSPCWSSGPDSASSGLSESGCSVRICPLAGSWMWIRTLVEAFFPSDSTKIYKKWKQKKYIRVFYLFEKSHMNAHYISNLQSDFLNYLNSVRQQFVVLNLSSNRNHSGPHVNVERNCEEITGLIRFQDF